MDSSIPDPPRKPKTPFVGISRKKKTSEGAAERAEKALKKPRKGGQKPASEVAPAPLPFDSTLTYAFRQCGGKEAAIQAARVVLADTDDERFARFIHAYDSLTATDQSVIKLEDLCRIAEISPTEFLEAVVPALFRRNVDIGKVIAAISHPRVVEATVESAMIPGGAGHKDRAVLLEHAGFVLPHPGIGINIDNSKKTVNVSGEPSASVERIPLPSFEDESLDFSSQLQGSESPDRAALPAPSPKQIVSVPEKILEAEVEEVPIVQPEKI